jgi:hypothetical protein
VHAVTGDLNLDGNDELILAHLSSSDRLTVLDGDAAWSGREEGRDAGAGRERRLRVGRGIQSLAVADLDADGDLDLACANKETDHIIPLRNLGDGTFEPVLPLVLRGPAGGNPAAASRPEAVLAGDLNADGILDLVAVNQGTKDVAVHLGRGDLMYAPAVRWAVGEEPSRPALADLDGDADLDLVVPGLFSDDLTVLENRGSGEFTTETLKVDAGPASAVAADFDGDGALDLAVANSIADGVQILLNRQAASPAAAAGASDSAEELAQNVPNPFNPATGIPYLLTRSGQVSLIVFNTSGKMVRTLVNRFEPAGPRMAIWDGTSDEGEKLPSGTYFYRLTTDGTVDLRRMTLIR